MSSIRHVRRVPSPLTRRFRIGIAVTIAAALGATSSSVMAQGNRFETLRQHAKKGPHLSSADADAVARELAQANFGTMLMGPLRASGSLTDQLVQDLTNLQMAWQGGKHGGIHETQLATSLNQHLELDRTPGYLRVRPDQVRRIRTQVWMRVPELSTGIDRRSPSAKGGGTIFSKRMSPFEAFLVADWLLYQKWTDDDFVKTPAEEQADKRKQKAPVPAGLSWRPLNPRREAFENHLRIMAANKWQSAEVILSVVKEILGGK